MGFRVDIFIAIDILKVLLIFIGISKNDLRHQHTYFQICTFEMFPGGQTKAPWMTYLIQEM